MIRITGVLRQEPQIFDGKQNFKLGQIEVWTSQYPEYHYGDSLEVVGKLNKKVNQVLFFTSNRYRLNSPQIKIRSAGKITWGITKTAIKIKQQWQKLFEQSLPKPLDGIMAGIVLGDKSLIPASFWEELRQTGTLHIMVASGMNIALVAGSALAILTLFFRRKVAIVFLLGLIWFYSILIGFSAPIVRAAVMASLTYLAQFLGREAESGRVLWLAGYFMLLVNPMLLWDVGFQLSFLATLGLIYFQPLLSSSQSVLLRNENFVSSLAAQLMTLPILAVNFGSFNLASPLINLAVLWAIPLLLQAGMAIGLVSLLWQQLGETLLLLLYPLLWWIWQVVELSARTSIFQIDLGHIGWWIWGLYYILLGVWLKKARKF
ncbi:MAG: ComEC/Rec2 family competence protein [Patescibacteria group bacterium]